MARQPLSCQETNIQINHNSTTMLKLSLLKSSTQRKMMPQSKTLEHFNARFLRATLKKFTTQVEIASQN